MKRSIADGSVGFPHVRVGHRQALNRKPQSRFLYKHGWVFNISMPALLFLSFSRLDLEKSFAGDQVFFSLLVTFVSFGCAWVLAVPVVKERENRGVFVQGAFRGNLAITGLAIAKNMYGPEGVGMASLFMAGMIIFFNILSIIVLEFYASSDKSRLSIRSLFRSISRNPLIIAVAVSLFIKLAEIPVPELIYQVCGYLGDIALPLALLGIGGTISLSVMAKTSTESFVAAFCKLVVIPAVVALSAIALGYRGMVLGVMFVLFASPTAVASFVMSKAIAGRGEMAANIIAITTVGAVLTNSIGIFLLRYFGFV